MSEPIQILRLGAGVQSSTLALKAAAGEVTPMPQCGVFADTQAEPKSVYIWLDWLEKQLPFPIYRVTAGSLEEDTLRIHNRKDGKGTWCPSGIPHYSLNADGSKGQGPRQCTYDFKLAPLMKKDAELVGNVRLKRWKHIHTNALRQLRTWEKQVADAKRQNKKDGEKRPIPMRPEYAWRDCQDDPLMIIWIGISWDEATRMKDPIKYWTNNRYPLVDTFTTRRDCLNWMKNRGFPQPPRSACVFCPFHSDAEWRRLRDLEPAEFARAVEFEKKYQAAKIATVSRKGFVPFLHDTRVSLSQVNFNTEEEMGQCSLNLRYDCEGMCGV